MKKAVSLLNLLPAKPALLVLDFDGVLTDNYVTVDQNGVESVRCSKEDSMGLTILRRNGFPVVILSSEANPVVAKRAEKLKIPCISGVEDKTVAFRALMIERKLNAADVIFVGNDVNDIGCLKEAGCGLVVGDAHPRVIPEADGVLGKPGGQGAVREVCEALFERLGMSAYFNDTERLSA